MEGKSKIFFGTGNVSKLNRIRAVTSELPLEILGIDNLNITVNVKEDGKNVHENAIKKAKAYFHETGLPTFSIDSGLYINKFSEENQPGLFVRRIHGVRATDQEMIDYYRKELKKIGGISKGRWISSIAFILTPTKIKKYELVEKRIFTAELSSSREEGLPLSSLAIEPTLNKYVSEITDEERWVMQAETDKKIFDIFNKILIEI